MKNPIPSDVWETKKGLISRLYKEEEWPLKQVIKQIRTEEFDPSETQLRSRLKKWRVTKPSRQVRKKPQYNQQEPSQNTGHAASVMSSRKPEKKGQSAPDQGWCIFNGMYSPRDQNLPSTAPINEQNLTKPWIPTMVQRQQQQQSLSPRGEDCDDYHSPPTMQFSSSLPNSAYYSQFHQSPVTEGAVMNNNVTPVTTPAYPSTTYPLSPVSRLQSPLLTTMPECSAQWPTASDQSSLGINSSLGPVAQWYSVASDALDQPLSIPFYAISPMHHPPMSNYGKYVSPVPPQTPGSAYSPQSPGYTSLWQEDAGDVKPPKGAKFTYYDPDPEHLAVDNQGRLRAHMDGRYHDI